MGTPPDVLRVVIVDDEEPARLALRHALGLVGGVEILAECENGFDAVRVVHEQAPDLLLLDVQMPRLDGFEVLELVGDIPVVFVTAYDEFALRAFEVHAVDYLLKPFSDERLAEAITRARERRLAPRPAATVLRSAARPADTPLERVVIRDGGQVHVLPVTKIDYVEAQDDYVAFRSGGRSFLKEQTLGEVEASLDPRRFVRVHRSYVLNIDRLAKVELYAKDSRVAVLSDGVKVPISRAGYQRLQKVL